MAPAAKKAPVPGKALATKKADTKVTQSDNPFAVAADPGVGLDIIEQDAAKGHGFKQDDLAIPFLRVLQKGSPEVNKRDDKYVEGAEVGMFFNTVTQELYDGEEKGVHIIPIHHEQNFTEWVPRSEGGGLVKDYGTDASILDKTTRDDKTGRDVLPNGHEVVRSAKYFIYLVDLETGEAKEMVFLLQSTQLKKARKWNTNMGTFLVPRPSGSGEFNPASYYVVYHVKTVYEENDKGDWMGVTVPAPVMPTINLPYGSNLYLKARQFKEMIVSGNVRTQAIIDQEAEIVTEEEEGSEDDGL